MRSGRGFFALINRTGNPILAALLRSPLHRIVSGQLALITVTGRKSGRRYTFPVGYRTKGDRVTIAVGWPAQKVWWRNLRGEGAPVTIKIGGAERDGHAVARGDESSGVVVEVELYNS